MDEKRKNGPCDSEIAIGKWLDQIGATKQYVGKVGSGPPDYVIQYQGNTIAVEVTLLHEIEGWKKKEEIAFERVIRRLIKEVLREGFDMPKWHVACEYDPRVPRPPDKNDDECKKRVQDALRDPIGGEFQLLSEKDILGRGVVLNLEPANNEGSFVGVSVDEGTIVANVLSERLVAVVNEKANKVRRGDRSASYSRWWLVLDDEVLAAPIRTLTGNERTEVDTRVRNSPGITTWSKVVMVSPFGAGSGRVHEYWFYAPWEDPRHPPLPTGPR